MRLAMSAGLRRRRRLPPPRGMEGISLSAAGDGHKDRKRGRAAERDVYDVDLGLLLEDLGREIRRTGNTGRGEVERTRLLLRQIDDQQALMKN